VKDEELMTKVLDLSLTDEVKAMDILPILLNMTTSKPGMVRAWAFFKTNVDIFKRKFVSYESRNKLDPGPLPIPGLQSILSHETGIQAV
jgi:hypothetical protein